ncbi:MAG TPA: response regulator [Candidatus Binatus sp.]|nr:response regulator [Candidatus Binatus sp.]
MVDAAMQEEAAEPSWMYLPIPVEEGVAGAARVLVGEDDADMRRLVAAMLRTEGYRVVEASDGAEVLEQIEATITGPPRDRIRAVVADIEMPELTGLDVLAALRCAQWQTPIILVTAFGNPDVRAEAEWLGALTLLEKPFRVDALRGAVHKALALPFGPCAVA